MFCSPSSARIVRYRNLIKQETCKERSIIIATIFEQVKRESSSDKVYSSIREAILSGKLKTGERLVETQLAVDFDVSRVVIRETLQRLAHHGLVTQNSYRGTHVIQLLPEDVDEIISVRAALEVEAVRQAKKRLREVDKREFRALVKKLESSIKNPKVHAELDFQLHEKIWDLSGNRTLKRILSQLTSPLFAMDTIVKYSLIIQKSGEDNWQPGEHKQLIEKFLDGTLEEAALAMYLHITQNWKTIRDDLEEFLETSLAANDPSRDGLSDNPN